MFLIANAVITEVKQFGKEKNHVEVTMARAGKPIEAITFFAKAEDFYGGAASWPYDEHHRHHFREIEL